MSDTAVMSEDRVQPRTPGALRARSGEHYFELAKVDTILGGPEYSSATGPCVEGDRMIMALMRMAAGTGSEFHTHPNEQWIFVLEGTLDTVVDGDPRLVTPGTLIYIPANTLHKAGATSEGDVVFFTAKDGSHGLHGIKAAS